MNLVEALIEALKEEHKHIEHLCGDNADNGPTISARQQAEGRAKMIAERLVTLEEGR